MNEPLTKIHSQQDLIAVIRALHQQGKKSVFTNGCFDLLHIGHTRYLQQARALGDFLIVAVNSDAGVQNLNKTRGRNRPGAPFVSQSERAEILASLACVEYVTIFEETTAEVLLSQLQPSLYVKGADYFIESQQQIDRSRLPEAAIVEGYGGHIALLPYILNHSTTNLIERIQKASL
jgi:D-beta-D-heptose 7-phosphate kinase/D-beta-D-heptose 1-phosphate adenosyltransferase